jgi:enoyl-CoA hydratase
MSLVLYQKRGAIAEATFNRPDKLNAINGAMLDELVAILHDAAADGDIRVLLLKGEGRAFSAGFDLDAGKSADGETEQDLVRRELTRDFDAIMSVWDFPKPTIAAVHGYCLCSSMEISAVCDITIASPECRFGAPEVRFGSGIVCLVLPWIVGQKRARELLLGGSDNVDASAALAMGLINRVVAKDALFAEARKLAAELAMNDPLAVRLTKRALNRSAEIAGMRQALDEALATDIEIETTETPESKAFNEILKTDGPRAALRWRAAQLPDRSGD